MNGASISIDRSIEGCGGPWRGLAQSLVPAPTSEREPRAHLCVGKKREDLPSRPLLFRTSDHHYHRLDFGLVWFSSVRKPFDSPVRLNRTRARRRGPAPLSQSPWGSITVGLDSPFAAVLGERATVCLSPHSLWWWCGLSPALFRLACGLTSKSLLPQRRSRRPGRPCSQPTAAIDEAEARQGVFESRTHRCFPSIDPPHSRWSRLRLARTERLKAQQGPGGTTLTTIDLPPRWPPAKGQSAS